MWCNQIFSLLSVGEIDIETVPTTVGVIRNIIVCDNFEIANQLAKLHYGDDAYAVDTTQYPVSLYCYHMEGKFFTEQLEEIPRTPTEAESVKLLEENLIEVAIDSDYRLSLIELGLV